MKVNKQQLIRFAAEHFETNIGEEVIHNIRTIDDLCKIIISENKVKVKYHEDKLFNKMSATINQLFGVSKENISPNIPLKNIIPSSSFAKNWTLLEKELGFKLPELQLSPFILGLFILTVTFSFFAGLFALLGHQLFYVAAMFFLITAVLVAFIFLMLSKKWFCNTVPHEPGTISDLIEFIVCYDYDTEFYRKICWNDEMVFNEIWFLLKDKMNVPDEQNTRSLILCDDS